MINQRRGGPGWETLVGPSGYEAVWKELRRAGRTLNYHPPPPPPPKKKKKIKIKIKILYPRVPSHSQAVLGVGSLWTPCKM